MDKGNSIKSDKSLSEEEMNQIVIAISISAFLLFLLVVGINEMIDFCQTTHRCGGR